MPQKAIWNEEYSVLNDQIDAQHKYLFEIYNSIHELIDTPEETEAVEQALVSLQNYIESHFKDEEELYEGHPLLLEHKQQHVDFMLQIDSSIADYNRGSLNLAELAEFIYDWLSNHILVVDGQYFSDMRSLA